MPQKLRGLGLPDDLNVLGVGHPDDGLAGIAEGVGVVTEEQMESIRRHEAGRPSFPSGGDE